MRDKTIAFAGMMQASELVHQIATSGQCSQQAARASIGSIFSRNPESTEAVYGGLGGVRMGLRVMIEIFSAGHGQDGLQALNYSLGLAKLGTKIERDSKRLNALGEDLDLVERAWNDADDELDDSLISQLADIYQRHVSTMDFRLSISGRPEYLKQTDKVSRVRALLLAGLRSAFLWRQVGGRSWRLVFHRRGMLEQAQALLTN
ncbi:high frequency lysogenization protein HflD [Wenzhouxiangella sp. AB-CW3]|uniref:high frequency lysogenization protein HflD n=1 Tax=Wenzhouxiangella sp. AB-CW3 TaxID=2771012 RepID=UPI00168BD168|nr:high frequency lysogenization protein HflD [Wenzhouxiangella sp. AB-CW3]QOC23897.1 high frequency lysogenization protein HflD [Wenzhouxiangella sp. AB-CW3]